MESDFPCRSIHTVTRGVGRPKANNGRQSSDRSFGFFDHRLQGGYLPKEFHSRLCGTAEQHCTGGYIGNHPVPACVPSTVWGTASMRNRQVVLGAVLAPQGRNATPPLVTASGRARPVASALPTTSRHLSSNRRHASRQRFPGADITPPIHALRARFTRLRAAIDKELAGQIEFVCSDMWQPYLTVIGE